MENILNENERLDDLQLGGLKIIQKVGGYGFTSDSVLLANFVKTKNTDLCVEIGCGVGVISILVNYKQKPQKITAFEIQQTQADLAVRNVNFCKMDDKIQIINDKIQNFAKFLPFSSIDVVFANPPYFRYDKNVCGENEEKVTSRFDKELPLSDLFYCVSKILRYGGKFFFVYDSSRVNECFSTMQKYNLMPKRVCFVHPNKDKNSTVFLCEASLGGKMDIKIMPPLFTNDFNGDYIQTIRKLFNTQN